MTIKDVAERAQVSTATVSRVVNRDSRITKATRDRVQLAIVELGYRVNSVARSLKSKRTFSVGILAPDIVNEFFMKVAEGVENRLGEDGYSMILANARESVARERNSLAVLLEKQVDGVIIIPTSDDGAHINATWESGTPVVLVDRLVNDYRGDAVLVDNEDATYNAVCRLITRGRRSFGFIGGQASVTTADERYRGFCRALDEFSIAINRDHVKFGDLHEESGYRLLGNIMSTPSPPDTVILANLFVHEGALRYISTHRDSMPRALCLAAFDDTKFSGMVGIPSITIAQPIDELGKRAAEILLRRIDGGNAAPVVERLKTRLTEYNIG